MPLSGGATLCPSLSSRSLPRTPSEEAGEAAARDACVAAALEGVATACSRPAAPPPPRPAAERAKDSSRSHGGAGGEAAHVPRSAPVQTDAPPRTLRSADIERAVRAAGGRHRGSGGSRRTATATAPTRRGVEEVRTGGSRVSSFESTCSIDDGEQHARHVYRLNCASLERVHPAVHRDSRWLHRVRHQPATSPTYNDGFEIDKVI